MRRLVVALAIIVFSATIVLGFSQVKWTSRDGSITVGKIEVRTGSLGNVEAKPLPYSNILYGAIDALAWYKPVSGSNPIRLQSLGSTLSVYEPPGRSVFFAQGRTWVLYFNRSSYMYYTSSVDGVTWANPTSLEVSPNHPPVAYFDGTYVHIAFQKGSPLYLCYVRGTPNSDGIITFGSVQNVIATSSNYAPTSITVDSNGYPWIGYRYSSDGSNWYPYVIKSSKNDGTWATASGFPYQLSTYADSKWVIEIVPLTSGKVVAFYTSSSRSVNAQSWSGSTWNSQAQAQYVFASAYGYPFASAVSVGDVAYLTYARASNTYLTLVKYTYSSNSFSNVVDVEASAISSCVAFITLDQSMNLLYIVYDNFPSAGVFYRVYNLTSLTLSDRVQVCSDTNIVVNSLSSPYKKSSSSDPVFAVFDVGSSDPRSLKFVWIQSVAQTQFQVAVSNLQVSGKYVKSKTSGVLDSANVTVKVYHNVDSNSTWVLAGQYNLANDTLLPYSTSFTTPWYSLMSGSFTAGQHTYYVKVEIVVQAWDAIAGSKTFTTVYTVCSMPLEWRNIATLGQLQVTETNMREVWNVPLYVATLVMLVSVIALVRLRERD